MKRFSQVEYDEASPAALVGASLARDEVYDVSDPIDVPVTSGRVVACALSNSDARPRLTPVLVGVCRVVILCHRSQHEQSNATLDAFGTKVSAAILPT